MTVASSCNVQVAIIARIEVLTVVLTKSQVWDVTHLSTGYTVTYVLVGYSAVPPASGSSSEHRVTS
jgi:hypothetical protein